MRRPPTERFASEVHVVHRRNALRASAIMQEKAQKDPKIRFTWDSEVAEVLGNERPAVTGVRLKNLKTGALTEHEVEGVFIAIGHQPNTAFLAGQLPMDERGYLLVEPGSTRTMVPGVFAAGDVADSIYRQAVTAAGTGCMAAIDAERYLEAEARMELGVEPAAPEAAEPRPSHPSRRTAGLLPEREVLDSTPLSAPALGAGGGFISPGLFRSTPARGGRTAPASRVTSRARAAARVGAHGLSGAVSTCERCASDTDYADSAVNSRRGHARDVSCSVQRSGCGSRSSPELATMGSRRIARRLEGMAVCPIDGVLVDTGDPAAAAVEGSRVASAPRQGRNRAGEPADVPTGADCAQCTVLARDRASPGQGASRASSASRRTQRQVLDRVRAVEMPSGASIRDGSPHDGLPPRHKTFGGGF